MVNADAAGGLSDFWLNILGLAVCGVLGLTACGMVKGLLALVRLHTASRNDTKRLAELKASKAASLHAVVKDLAVEKVCYLAKSIQLKIGSRGIAGTNQQAAPFSIVLAKHTSKFAAFLERAGLDSAFDIDGAAVNLMSFAGGYGSVDATRLFKNGYVSLARDEQPWPCALVEHYDWVRDNLYGLEPQKYHKYPLPDQLGFDGKLPTAPDPDATFLRYQRSDCEKAIESYKEAWRKALHATPLP